MVAIKRRWPDYDPAMLITTLVLMGFGVVAIWSAAGGGALMLGGMGIKQALFGAVGLCLMVMIASFDYRFLGSFAWFIYGGALFFLAAVLIKGQVIAGSQRWFAIGESFSVQPSEFGKLAAVIALAAFISSRGAAMREFGNFAVSILIVAVPMALVFVEPDLGSTIVYGVIWVSMMIVARTRKIYFALMIALAAPFLFAAWTVVLASPDYEYMRERLLVSYNPKIDELGAGFNIIQARISIGSGGLYGDGLAGGSQSQLNLLSVRETDFIFAHAAGMFGFLGMLALFASFILLIWRCLRVVEMARDPFGQCLAVGITGIVFFQAFVNIGMNVGLMPVTGITLPFVSYGISSLWTFLLAEGLLQSILIRQRRLAFKPT